MTCRPLSGQEQYALDSCLDDNQMQEQCKAHMLIRPRLDDPPYSVTSLWLWTCRWCGSAIVALERTCYCGNQVTADSSEHWPVQSCMHC